jgi:hypothetical protein
MMERVIKGRFTPLVVIFFCFLLPQLIINLTVTKNYYIASMFGAIMAIYLLVFLIGARGYLNMKNKRR